MMWEFGIKFTSGRLYNGYRSIFVSFTLGRTWWWVMRWDTARTKGHRFLSRDGLMGWTWGVRRPISQP